VSSLTIQIDNNSVLFTDANLSVHRLYFAENTVPTHADNFTRIPNGNLDNLSYTFSGASAGDNLTLYAWAIDTASNISDNVSLTVTFDNATPTAGDNATITNAVTYDNQTFYLQGTSATFGLSGVGTDNTSLTYHINDNGSDRPTSFSSAGTQSFSLASDNDNQTLYVWAKDAAGNISASYVDNLTVIVDNTDPVFDNLTLTKFGGGAELAIGADNLSVVFDNVTDNFSGVYAYYVSTLNDFDADNSSQWTTSWVGGDLTVSPTISTVTNSEEGSSRTVYATVIDTAWNAKTTTLTIPVASNKPVQTGVRLINPSDNTTDNITGQNNVTVEILGNDNANTSGGAVVSYYITNDVSKTPSTSDSWTSFTTPGTSVSENVTFDLNYILTPDDNSTLTLYVWLRDNSSNISDNYSSDNITYFR
jgi:hypothetical protein